MECWSTGVLRPRRHHSITSTPVGRRSGPSGPTSQENFHTKNAIAGCSKRLRGKARENGSFDRLRTGSAQAYFRSTSERVHRSATQHMSRFQQPARRS